jgi:hypothetical protein
MLLLSRRGQLFKLLRMGVALGVKGIEGVEGGGGERAEIGLVRNFVALEKTGGHLQLVVAVCHVH